jgi:hypothetical protein
VSTKKSAVVKPVEAPAMPGLPAMKENELVKKLPSQLTARKDAEIAIQTVLPWIRGQHFWGVQQAIGNL